MRKLTHFTEFFLGWEICAVQSLALNMQWNNVSIVSRSTPTLPVVNQTMGFMKANMIFFVAMFLMMPHIYAQSTINLNANDKGRVFEGIGAVSAGASSRALIDYPNKQRDEVLDFLFKPKFGAGFQHLKVEIGSGENSTCGAEPSHAITREELKAPKPRGYEFWLMAEARKRNPKVMLDCLPWAYPNWVGDRFSQDSADWIVAFLEVARKHYGMEMDYVSAAQNEMGTNLNWIAKKLKTYVRCPWFFKSKAPGPG